MLRTTTFIVGLLLSCLVMAGSEPMSHEISGLKSLSKKLEQRISSPQTLSSPAITRTFKDQISRFDKSLSSYIEKYPAYDFSQWSEVLSTAKAMLAGGAPAVDNNIASAASPEKKSPSVTTVVKPKKTEPVKRTSTKAKKVAEPHKGTTGNLDRKAAELIEAHEQQERLASEERFFGTYFKKYVSLRKIIAREQLRYPDYDFSKWTNTINDAETVLKQIEQSTGYAGKAYKPFYRYQRAIAAMEKEFDSPVESLMINSFNRDPKKARQAIKEAKKYDPDFDFSAFEKNIDSVANKLELAINNLQAGEAAEKQASRDKAEQYQKSRVFSPLPAQEQSDFHQEHLNQIIVSEVGEQKATDEVSLEDGFAATIYLDDSLVNQYRKAALLAKDRKAFQPVNVDIAKTSGHSGDFATDLKNGVLAIRPISNTVKATIRIFANDKLVVDQIQNVEVYRRDNNPAIIQATKDNDFINAAAFELNLFPGKTGTGLHALADYLMFEAEDEDQVIYFEVELSQQPELTKALDLPALKTLRSNTFTIEMDESDVLAYSASRRSYNENTSNYHEGFSEELFDQVKGDNQDLINLFVDKKEWIIVKHPNSGVPLFMKSSAVWVNKKDDKKCTYITGVVMRTYDGSDYADPYLNTDKSQYSYPAIRCELIDS